MKNSFGLDSLMLGSFLFYKYGKKGFGQNALLIFNEIFFPVTISFIVKGSIIEPLLFFYVYEVGYYFNDFGFKLVHRTKSVFLVLFRLIVAGTLLWGLDCRSEFVVNVILTAVLFCVHNVLWEGGQARVVTWISLNVFKWYIYVGDYFYVFFPLVVSRLFLYLNKKGYIQVSLDPYRIQLILNSALLIVLLIYKKRLGCDMLIPVAFIAKSLVRAKKV
jgi:hypothetical protein